MYVLRVCVNVIHVDYVLICVPECQSMKYVPYLILTGHAVAQLVEALRYKPEGRGFDSRWCHWIFSLT
jgi:hypothetical protein